MTLNELIQQVKEEKLSKEQLEKYSDQLVYLFNDMQSEMAELEKLEARFMNEIEGVSVAEKKIKWKASDKGQRLIELKRYSIGCSKIINSVKSRVFRLIY